MNPATTVPEVGLRPPGPWRRRVAAVVSALMLSACAVGVEGYGPGYYAPDGYVGGVYEPYGYDYGGWGGRYRVGPPRGGPRGGGDFHGGEGPRGGGGRAAPSIPSGPRGGGGHPR